MPKPNDSDFTLAADPRFRRRVLMAAYAKALGLGSDSLALRVLAATETSQLVERLTLAVVVGGFAASKDADVIAAWDEWDAGQTVKDGDVLAFYEAKADERAEFVKAGGKADEAPRINPMDVPRRPNTDPVGAILEATSDAELIAILDTVWASVAAAEDAAEARELAQIQAATVKG